MKSLSGLERRRFISLHRFMGRTRPGDSCLAEPGHKSAWVKAGLMSWDVQRGAWVLTDLGAALVSTSTPP